MRMTSQLRGMVLLGCFWVGTLGGSTAEPVDYEAYVAHPQQTWKEIAGEYGLAVELLARFNNAKPTDALPSGQIVRVPIVSTLTPLPPAVVDLPPSAALSTPTPGIAAVISAVTTPVWSKPGRGPLVAEKLPRGTEVLVIGQDGTFCAILMSDGSTGWVTQEAIALTDPRQKSLLPGPQPAPGTLPGPSRSVVETALTFLGTPYRYGGRLPESVDCSLLVQTVFSRHQLKLPRTAAQQSAIGQPIELTELQLGDRLYFTDRSGRVGHTGIYLGEGRFVHASSTRGAVAIDELANPMYWKKYAGARR